MSTPEISHISNEDYYNVYEPAEDSFLFLDALQKEMRNICNRRPTVCLEVGSGTGIVSTFLAKELGYPIFCLCTDINAHAVNITRETGRHNHVSLEPVLTDLVSGMLERLKNKVDLLLFNPPYVVTPREEVGSHGIEASWAGGLDGREVIDRVLPLVPDLLSQNGVFYMVVIKENKPEELGAILGKSGFSMKTVLSRKSGPEHLSVLEFTRSHANDNGKEVT